MQLTLNDYRFALLGVGAILLLVMVQWLIASGRKAKQPGAIPGKPPSQLSQQDFTFRAWRTHQNTLENLGTMLGGSFFAMLAGASVAWVTSLVWVMVIARLLHMALYYAIATDKNPSPRSYFFMLGWVANLTLITCGVIALF